MSALFFCPYFPGSFSVSNVRVGVGVPVGDVVLRTSQALDVVYLE